MTSHKEETRLQVRFLAAVGEELRSPLGTIIGLAEKLAGGMVPAPTPAEYSGRILGSARQLMQTLTTLLELARADAGELELIRQPADLAVLVADAVRLVQPAAAQKGVKITADFANAPARVCLDAPRIMHALHGFLTGAIHLTAEGKTIALRAALDGEDSVRLEVMGLDIGPGQTAEFVVPTPRAWLGLALARGIVEAHGGRIGFSSAPDRRRVLHATLPGVIREGLER